VLGRRNALEGPQDHKYLENLLRGEPEGPGAPDFNPRKRICPSASTGTRVPLRLRRVGHRSVDPPISSPRGVRWSDPKVIRRED